jgi:hypothetical protein
MMEYWNNGIMGTAHSIMLKNTTIHGINNAIISYRSSETYIMDEMREK